MKTRWAKFPDCQLYETRPFDLWRCRVWLRNGTWEWEARRFGRYPVHVGGGCSVFAHAKKVSVAAAAAIRGSK